MGFAPHPLTLRQLQYIAAVADTRSFRRAAALCHVAQPSLSAQVAQVEEALGVALFERDRRGVLVTKAGEAVLERVRALLRDADDLVATAQRFSDPLAGMLRVGVIPTISPYLLPEIATKLREEFPRLHLLYTEDKTATLVSMLENGTLDAAIVASEAELGELTAVPFAQDPFVLAVPRNHRLATRKRSVTLLDLEGENVLLLDDGHCFREQAISFCRNGKIEELGFRATSLATLAQMVAGGAGVTLLPSLAVPIENRRGDLSILRFTRPEPGRTLALAFRPGSAARDGLTQIAAALERATAPLTRRAPAA